MKTRFKRNMFRILIWILGIRPQLDCASATGELRSLLCIVPKTEGVCKELLSCWGMYLSCAPLPPLKCMFGHFEVLHAAYRGPVVKTVHLVGSVRCEGYLSLSLGKIIFTLDHLALAEGLQLMATNQWWNVGEMVHQRHHSGCVWKLQKTAGHFMNFNENFMTSGAQKTALPECSPCAAW